MAPWWWVDWYTGGERCVGLGLKWLVKDDELVSGSNYLFLFFFLFFFFFLGGS